MIHYVFRSLVSSSFLLPPNPPLPYSAVVHSSSVALVESIQLGGYSSTMLPWRSFDSPSTSTRRRRRTVGGGGVILSSPKFISNSSKSKFLLFGMTWGLSAAMLANQNVDVTRAQMPKCPLHSNMTNQPDRSNVPQKSTRPPRSFLKKEEEKVSFFKLLFYMIFL